MAIGFVDFTVGQVFGADDADGILRQTMMVFASTSARDTDLSGALEEGMHCYTTDTNSIYLYTGAAWRRIHSPQTTFTPAWTNVTVGNGTAAGRYAYTPDGVRVRASLVFGSTTAFTGTVRLTIPNSETAASGPDALGDARFVDDSTAANSTTGACTAAAGGTNITPQSAAGSTIINSTAPFTWTTSDILTLDIVVPL